MGLLVMNAIPTGFITWNLMVYFGKIMSTLKEAQWPYTINCTLVMTAAILLWKVYPYGPICIEVA